MTAVIVHHAEPHHAFDLVFTQTAHSFVVQQQNAPRVTEQPLARGTQIDVDLGTVKTTRHQADLPDA